MSNLAREKTWLFAFMILKYIVSTVNLMNKELPSQIMSMIHLPPQLGVMTFKDVCFFFNPNMDSYSVSFNPVNLRSDRIHCSTYSTCALLWLKECSLHRVGIRRRSSHWFETTELDWHELMLDISRHFLILCYPKHQIGYKLYYLKLDLVHNVAKGYRCEDLSLIVFTHLVMLLLGI